TIERATNRHAEALRTFAAAAKVLPDLRPTDPDAARDRLIRGRIYSNIGSVESDLGRAADALKSYQTARAVLGIRSTGDSAGSGDLDRLHSLARIENNVAQIHLEASQTKEALSAFRGSLAALEALTRARSGDTEARTDLTIALNNTAQLLYLRNEYD